MIDWFVLFAPIYLLGVIALLGFVGCNWIYGLDETVPQGPPAAPTNLFASAADGKVTLAWTVDPGATSYHLLRAEMSGSVPADYPVQRVVQPNQIPYTDNIDIVNGTTYFYRVTALNSAGESDPSDEVNAMPTWPFGAFVTNVMAGTPRAGMNGFFGMAIEVGPVALTIQKLGRSFTPALTGPHEVRLIDGATKAELGRASVDMNSPAEGNFRYAPIVPASVTVSAGGIYYIVSQEFNGGDQFYDQDTIVQHRVEARVNSAVYSDSPGLYVPVGQMDHSYGPVSFQY